MKKLQELIALRSDKNTKFQGMELTDATRSEFDALEAEITALDGDITRLQKQEEANKRMASVNIISKVGDNEQSDFSRALGEMFTKGSISGDFRGSEGLLLPNSLYRANPVLTTTNTAIINKMVDPNISIAKSHGEMFLRGLGVRFVEGINGNLVLPAMAESVAVMTNEAGDSSTANQAPTSITLAAKRLDTFNGYTREFLAQSSLYGGLIQDLVDAIGVKMVYQFFGNMQVDAVDASIAGTPAGVSFLDILKLEKNLGDIYGNTSFVATPTAKAYLKNLNAGAAGIKFVWSDMNEMIGLPAASAKGVNAGQIWLGDWTKATVATFGTGGIELVVDPYSLKKAGNVEVYAVQLVDSGTPNYRHFSWIGDASVGA